MASVRPPIIKNVKCIIGTFIIETKRFFFSLNDLVCPEPAHISQSLPFSPLGAGREFSPGIPGVPSNPRIPRSPTSQIFIIY